MDEANGEVIVSPVFGFAADVANANGEDAPAILALSPKANDAGALTGAGTAGAPTPSFELPADADGAGTALGTGVPHVAVKGGAALGA